MYVQKALGPKSARVLKSEVDPDAQNWNQRYSEVLRIIYSVPVAGIDSGREPSRLWRKNDGEAEEVLGERNKIDSALIGFFIDSIVLTTVWFYLSNIYRVRSQHEGGGYIPKSWHHSSHDLLAGLVKLISRGI